MLLLLLYKMFVDSMSFFLFLPIHYHRMQAHFENIQRISDTITLPHSMHNLSCRIAQDLDLSHLLERLIQGKGQPNTLTQSEKLDLWSRLKILSMNLLFTPFVSFIAVLIHFILPL